jgi:hypothetical protein
LEDKLDIKQYKILQQMYEYFNNKLFDSVLPDVIFLLESKKVKYHGYFHFEKQKTKDGKLMSVINLNTETFDREPVDVLSTVAHEMVHCWEFYFGEPPSKGYHGKQFVKAMEKIGLIASSTGEPGGKQSGRRMTHYIAPGGRFEIVAKEFLAMEENVLLFEGIKQMIAEGEKKSPSGSKIKYSCPECSSNVWGKHGLRIICEPCGCEYIEPGQVQDTEGDSDEEQERRDMMRFRERLSGSKE